MTLVKPLVQTTSSVEAWPSSTDKPEVRKRIVGVVVAYTVMAAWNTPKVSASSRLVLIWSRKDPHHRQNLIRMHSASPFGHSSLTVWAAPTPWGTHLRSYAEIAYRVIVASLIQQAPARGRIRVSCYWNDSLSSPFRRRGSG